MRQLTIVAVIATMASQLALPALAADTLDPSGPQGWRRGGDAAAVAYFRLPLQSPGMREQPRAGFKLVAPRPSGMGETSLHLRNPALADFAFTGRSFDAPWTATLALGQRTAWAADPSALPPGAKLGFLEDSGVSWIVVGALTVAAGVGIFAVIEK